MKIGEVTHAQRCWLYVPTGNLFDDREVTPPKRPPILLLRASREASRLTTRPALPRPISAINFWKPWRSTLPVPDLPRSWSMTCTRPCGHPRATARSTSRYCSSVLSWCCFTWLRDDCRDPIDSNGAVTFSRLGFDGAFALSWQLPPPLTASSKSSPKRPYAKRFLRAFEYLDMRDGLPFAEQSCRSGSRLEFVDASTNSFAMLSL